jgi:hypothetical protein
MLGLDTALLMFGGTNTERPSGRRVRETWHGTHGSSDRGRLERVHQ